MPSPRCIGRTIVISSAVLLATSTASRFPLEAADEGGAEAVAVRELQQDMVKAFNAHDLDRLMAYHHPDVMYLVPNEPPITGLNAVRGMYDGVFSTYKRLKVTGRLEVETAEVIVSGDWAWARGQARSVVSTLDGVSRPNPGWTKHLSIYKKQNGTWMRYRQMRSEN